jgi:hypothetical protein
MKRVLITWMLVALANVAMASTEDELTSLSYISYLERYATVLPASQEESLEAVINMPLVAGDRVDTAREARMEIVLADGDTMWLDEYTTLSLDAVAFSRDSEAERTVIFLAEGTIIVEVSGHIQADKPTRIDSRGATIYLDQQGLYRIHSLPTGGLRVEVAAGLAEAATSAGGVLIRPETSAEVGSGEVQRTEPNLTWNDDFAAWVEMRRQIVTGESAQHVDLRYSRQAAQLDNYGSWVYVDSLNSWAWQPEVGGGWEPYRAGRWHWTNTGWAWISYEPWGWLPYHYGSWNFDIGFGWVWSWGGTWGPSWVNWVWWPGYVGWCPYGYYNSWYWNSYGGYYPGYYPPHRPPHPGGGGSAQPPRRDVMPQSRTASGRMAPTASQTQAVSRSAVDINGRVQVASMDRRGWTVVAQEDFASPNLARVARPGDRVMPSVGDDVGVVMTGPLTTRSPSLARPAAEIERVFLDVESRSNVDVTPLMARNSSLPAETARSLGRQTTFSDLSRRSTNAAATSRQTVSPRLSAGAGSPFSRSSSSRTAQPNLYRPTLYSVGDGVVSGSGGSGSSAGSRQLVAPRSSVGSSGVSRPVIVPGTSSSIYSRPPATSSVPRTGSQSSAGSVRGYSSAPSSRTISGSRSTPSRSRSSAGSSRSTGSRSSPSTVSRRSGGGGSRPSASSSRSGGSSSRSSAGSSRPSGSSKKPSGSSKK